MVFFGGLGAETENRYTPRILRTAYTIGVDMCGLILRLGASVTLATEHGLQAV